jgi:hemoglobin-like flavoprotein
MREQGMKIAAALELVIDNLHAPERLTPVLEELGRRHDAYGVLPEHFDTLGRTLIEVLAELEGDAWSAGVEQAWTRAYAQMADSMRRGLEAAQQARRAALGRYAVRSSCPPPEEIEPGQSGWTKLPASG